MFLHVRHLLQPTPTMRETELSAPKGRPGEGVRGVEDEIESHRAESNDKDDDGDNDVHPERSENSSLEGQNPPWSVSETTSQQSDAQERQGGMLGENSQKINRPRLCGEGGEQQRTHQRPMQRPRSPPLPIGVPSQTNEATFSADDGRSAAATGRSYLPRPLLASSPPPPPVLSSPGAYRVRPAGASRRGDDDDDDDSYAASPDSAILWVEASLAADEDDVARRPEAMPQSPCVAEATPIVPRRRRRAALVAIAAVAVAVVATVVGVAAGLFANRTSRSASVAVPRPPTSAPTSEPGERFLQSLPPHTRASLRNESSPQSRAFAWVSRNDTVPRRSDADGADDDEQRVLFRMIQRFVLATLFYATGGETTWIERQNWLDPAVSECDWRGCCCGPRCKVFEGDSSPEDFFGNETFEVVLSGLFLSGNRLAGRLPPELGMLTQLERLDVNRNRISGPIPTQLSDVTGLITFRMDENLLTGAIPTELGLLTDLVDVRLRGANDTSFLSESIPSELGLLSGLTALDLGSHHLNATLPTELGRLTRLRKLWLDNNQLSGPVPSQLGQQTNLRQLWLSNNSLVGALPPEILKLPVLQVLSVENNRIASTVPTQIGSLSALEELSLGGNALTGPLPIDVGLLTALGRISLGSNRLTSTLPTQVGQLARLELLVARNNSFTGSLPPEIGNLTALMTLDVGTNSLNSTIPTTLGELSSLRELRLDKNGLSGSVPSELGRLSSLETAIRLGGNQLVGTVPGELCRLLVENRVRLIVDCQDVACSCNCTCAGAADDDTFYAT
jgi:Leucine-rich repeat (LRR) protein